MKRRVAPGLLAAVLATTTAALAAPPDARLALIARTPHFERVGDEFHAVLVDAPDLIHAELLATQELLLEPRGPGVAHVFLFAERLVRVIEVAVEVPLPPPATDAPPVGCTAPDGSARIANAACYQHWRARLSHLPAAEAPTIAFEDAGLLAEAKAAQQALDEAGVKLKVAVTAFGVRLVGESDQAAQNRALLTVWPAILGPLRVDR